MSLPLVDQPLGAARTEPSAPSSTAWPAGGLLPARLQRIDDDGWLVVELPDNGGARRVAWLESADNRGLRLVPGDQLLVAPPQGDAPAVALGRIGRYTPPAPSDHVTIEATESLTLKCGASSVDLRADGKLMVRGDDVLVRAKGTQTIRAGSVSIN